MKNQFELPQMPSFIRAKALTKKQSTFVHILDLTEEQALEYAEQMKQAFISHWQSKKQEEAKFQNLKSK